MCTGIETILGALSIVASVGTSIAGYAAQSSHADAQEEYQRKLAEARNEQIRLNQQLAMENFQNQANAVRLRQLEEQEKDIQDVEQKHIQSLKLQARTRVAAGEAGVAGLSVNQLLADFHRQEAVFRDSVAHNREFRSRRADMELEQLGLQTKGRQHAIQPYIPSPIARPSFLGTALEIGSNLIAGASNLYGTGAKLDRLDPNSPGAVTYAQ